MTAAKRLHQHAEHHAYDKFRSINGDHDLKHRAPFTYVEYRAKPRPNGHVAYFNFYLAKEMGLIPKDHPHRLNQSLEQTLLDVFAIEIINEYDLINDRVPEEKDLKANSFMATRYLQLQHPNKTGVTSGDGRSLWNGQFSHRGTTWDITSCGTGATCLSPATALQKKFFRTGDPSVSYGCGYAEISEGIGNAIFSEIFHRNGIETERTLCVIEFPRGLAINVRAGKNLLRPSHFFNHLKQAKPDRLAAIVNTFIDRQISNGEMKPAKASTQRYQNLLEYSATTFANMAARFESDYIFCWMDWDGDNILCNGGIIDYGSIRQFGLFHHEYRFDDVERWSTNLTEQRLKARYTVQTFAQLCDYLITGRKKRIEEFRKHRSLKIFDRSFVDEKLRLLITKIGYDAKQCEFLLQHHRREVVAFQKDYDHFERTTSIRGPVRLEDGITRNAIFCMRDALRELPKALIDGYLSAEAFLAMIKSSYASRSDLRIHKHRRAKVSSFQHRYLDLVEVVAKRFEIDRSVLLKKLATRSSVINRYDRITGDAMIHVATALLRKMPKMSFQQNQRLIEDFVEHQVMNNEHTHTGLRVVHKRTPEEEKIFSKMKKIVKNYREGL